MAACVGYERFEIRNKYTRAKILGTLLCVGGAIAVSILLRPAKSSPGPQPGDNALPDTASMDWIIGCICLLLSVLSVASANIVTATTLANFPAPISICVISLFLGSVFTAIVQIITEGKLNVGSTHMTTTDITGAVLLTGLQTSVASVYITWCMRTKGPVAVIMFCPVQTVFSLLLSAILLRQVVGPASIAAILLLFAGLYAVIWAKHKEDSDSAKAGDSATMLIPDIEKSLL